MRKTHLAERPDDRLFSRRLPTFVHSRTPVYATAEDLAHECSLYEEFCETKNRIMTVPGLCLFLGLSRQTLYKYQKGGVGDDYKQVVNFFMLRIEEEWVQNLTKPNAGGAMFYLKNAFRNDYREKIETEYSEKPLRGFLLGLKYHEQPPKDSAGDGVQELEEESA